MHSTAEDPTHTRGICSPLERLASLFLDIVIGGVILTLASGAAFLALPSSKYGAAPGLLSVVALYLLYHVVFLTGFGGLPGQLLLGQRVIYREERTHLSPPTAILRAAVGAVSVLAFGLGYLTMPFTQRAQALHDIVAGSIVLKVRDRGALDGG